MKRIKMRSSDRIVDDGTHVPAGTPHFEQDSVAADLIARGLAVEVPEDEPAQGDLTRDEKVNAGSVGLLLADGDE